MEELQKKAGRPKSRQSIAHIPRDGNATTDIAAFKRAQDAQVKAKRARGKSLGPGGLEALQESDGNVAKAPPVFVPKSILKPTVPLTPPKNIPSFDELRKRSTSKAKSPTKDNADELLIDFSTPGPARESAPTVLTASYNAVADPFSPFTRTTSNVSAATDVMHDEEDDQEAERRRAQKEAILEERKKRADKRKSMGLRRVSFAPEATLHTWSVMDLMEDSTTSSASNSTRRQSSMVEPPSTSSAQNELGPVQKSPDRQQTPASKSRPNSEDNEDSDGDVFSSPGDGGESSPIRVEESIDSESDTDGDTAMSLDETTANTIASSDSAGSQSSLNERLRAAATQAGTRGIEYDENLDDAQDDDDDDEEQSMEFADGTVTHAFRQFARKGHNVPASIDKENVNPFDARVVRASLAQEELDNNTTVDMTMDMTKAVGGILAAKDVRNKPPANRRRSSVAKRYSMGSEADDSMDLTVAKGGILNDSDNEDDGGDEAEDGVDDATMEFTTAVGGFQPGNRREISQASADDETEPMDMTMATGGMLEPIEEQTEPQTDIDEGFTAAMDMTKAVGQILSKQQVKSDESPEVDATTQDQEVPSPSAQLNFELNTATRENSPKPANVTMVDSTTGSPSWKPRLSGRKSAPASNTNTPKPTPTRASARKEQPSKTSPGRKSATPTKQATPLPAKSASPVRNTPVTDKNVSLRVSPKKLFQAEIKERASPAQQKSSKKQYDLLFSTDATTGAHTPKVVLHAPKPHQHLRRRSSGIGADKEGTGSPRVSELLSRRSSIGDAVPEFKLGSQKPKARFEDPQQIEQEVDKERAEEQRRESGRFVMEQEADDRQEENATLQLRDMITAMSPKKDKSARARGRKSLAVGSARGLLGKRPAELDDEDEDEDASSTPKRLRAASREGSPVKKVHLPHPPTKEETTGRLSRLEQAKLAELSATTPTLAQSPVKEVLSPVRVGRFKDQTAVKATSFENKLDNVIDAIDVATAHPELAATKADDEKIPLQQFLNMTNIHFIELSTTKRRHTTAQSMLPPSDGEAANNTSEASFVAATTTMPLLELYQHATRELKSYISTGRKIIRSIEAETLAEQPPLFREYVEARPEVKAIMDNQFRNGKTNARLLSREGWYSWRGQLVDGLRSGLENIKGGLEKDRNVLQGQVEDIDKVLPDRVSRRDALQKELAVLKARMSHLDSIDRDALQESRRQLQTLDKQVADQQTLADTLQKQMSEKEEALSQAAELRIEMHEQIAEAVRVREAQQGWPVRDILALKTRVDQIQQEHGWQLLTAQQQLLASPDDFGVQVTLRYKSQLNLSLYPSAFEAKQNASRRRSGRGSSSVSGPGAPIRLTYCPDEDTDTPTDPSTERRFFLQLIRSQLQAFSMMPKGSVSCRTVLSTVSEGWTLADRISEEVRLLNILGVVRVNIQSDERLSVKVNILQKRNNRIDVDFNLSVLVMSEGEISSTTSISAEVIYGSVSRVIDGPKIRKVQSALTKEVESKELGGGSWANAVWGFEDWLKTQMEPPQPEKEPIQTSNAVKKTKPAASVAKTTHQPSARSTTPAVATAEHSSNQEELVPPTGRTIVQHSPISRPTNALSSSTQHRPGAWQSSTPPRRSPLAPKTTNSKIGKKSIPIASNKVNAKAAAILAHEAAFAEAERKENVKPSVDVSVSKKSMEADDVFGGSNKGHIEDKVEDKLAEMDWGNAAIPPEVQEQMMRTPVKRRVGALRRSPI